MSDQQFLTEEEYALLRREKCSKLTDDQFAIFRHAIERFRLDPFGNQIYAQVRTDRKTNRTNMSIQTGIDGYRLIADRTGNYAGNDDPLYDNEDKPMKATVTVYKVVHNLRCPFTSTARWDQYFPGEYLGAMWRKMPHLMLGKCAEALALRKAFPAELSGLYTAEEMQQDDGDAPPVNVAGPASVDDFTKPAEDKPTKTPSKPRGAKSTVGKVDETPANLVGEQTGALANANAATSDTAHNKFDADMQERSNRAMQKELPSDPTPVPEKQQVQAQDELGEWETAVEALLTVKSCMEFHRDVIPGVDEVIRVKVLAMLLRREMELETSIVNCKKLALSNPTIPGLVEEAEKNAARIRASRGANS